MVADVKPTGSSGRSGVEAAITAVGRGQPVVVADAPSRENEGDLIMAARAVTSAHVAFFLRYGSGIVCAPIPEQRAAELGLDLMVAGNTDPHLTAFTVSVDHVSCGTGISAVDRAATLRSLADWSTHRSDLRRPGHVFPLISRPGGCLERAGHTEAATDLVRMANAGRVGVITELVGDDGVPLSGTDLVDFAAQHDLAYTTVADLIAYRRQSDHLVRCGGRARLPTSHGEFEVRSYTSTFDGLEHVVLSAGDLGKAGRNPEGVLVRVHSECMTGDLLGSLRCDCGHQLTDSLDMIARKGAGVLVYLHGHEGRGIGLGAKLQAYALQDMGRDTVNANLELGFPADMREYGVAAAILADLGVSRISLISNNPEKCSALASFGLELVTRVGLPPRVTHHNFAYLATKCERMGHLLDIPALLGAGSRSRSGSVDLPAGGL